MFIFLISLLISLIVKFSYILPWFTLSLLQNTLDQNERAFNTKFGRQWKDRESIYQVRETLVRFCKLVALILLTALINEKKNIF